MEFTDLISWGFQALFLGGVGLIWAEIRKLRERERELDHRIAGIETKIAANYVTREEIDRILNRSFEKIERGMERLSSEVHTKLNEYDRSIRDFNKQHGHGLDLLEKYASLLPMLERYLEKHSGIK